MPRRSRLVLPILFLAAAGAEEALPPEAAALVNGESLPLAALQEALLKRHGTEMLRELVLRKLVDQEAKRTGIRVEEAEVLRRVEIALQAFREQAGAPLELGAFLQSRGISEADFREQVLVRLTLEKLVVRDTLCGTWVRLKAVYASTEEKARELLKRLEEGADFGTLAKTESVEASSAARDGDLGLCFRGELPSEMEEPAFTLPVGTLSGVIRTPAGFLIFRVEERQEARERPYEELKEELLKRWDAATPEDLEVQRYLLRLKRKASIQTRPEMNPFP